MSLESENRPTIQIRIRDLRRQRSLTQEELADALGISRQSINAMEAGRTLPSLPMALQIAQFFAVPLNSVFLVDILEDGTLLPVIANNYSQFWASSRHDAANLWETEQVYLVEFLTPGLRLEDLQLDVDDEWVTLTAKAPQVTMDCELLTREFTPPSYTRTVRLPSLIRSEGVRAQLQSGILRVLLPKLQSNSGSSRHIEIEALD